MIANKKIVLELLFEHYKISLSNYALEELADDQVLFCNDICLHGSNVFDIALKIVEIEINDDNFEDYYDPFFEITQKDLNTKQAEEEILKYYNWLVDKKK